MSNISEEKLNNIVNLYHMHGIEKTAKMLNLQVESIRRYVRKAIQLGIVNENTHLLKKIESIYTKKELQTLAGSGVIEKSNSVHLKFAKQFFKALVITDTHIGSKYTIPDYITDALEKGDKENIDYIFHVGDVVEGMSNRPGHIYELTEIGYDAQKNKAIEIFKNINKPMYVIDGNHDRWYIKGSGALIVKDIANEIPNMTFIGHDEGSIYIDDIEVMLWHGEDGSSYAHSYRIQKLVESLQGGEKPNVLLTGHVHKSIYVYERNIQTLACGALQFQSKWMRSKRLPSHTGFWIIEVGYDSDGVKEFIPRWFPIYK
jgi:predicted phosphodiesterase